MHEVTVAEVTVAKISDYRRPNPYKVIVQQIAPASLLQRMAEVAEAFSAAVPEPLSAYATVTPIDRFHPSRNR